MLISDLYPGLLISMPRYGITGMILSIRSETNKEVYVALTGTRDWCPYIDWVSFDYIKLYDISR